MDILVPHGSVVMIYSDSKSPLQALASAEKTIPIITKTQRLALQLNNRFTVTFHWVPGHEGIPGNELADREALALTMNRNIPIICISWISMVKRQKPVTKNI